MVDTQVLQVHRLKKTRIVAVCQQDPTFMAVSIEWDEAGCSQVDLKPPIISRKKPMALCNKDPRSPFLDIGIGSARIKS
jgi:hypothetical protein